MVVFTHPLTGREQMKALAERMKYRREMLGLTQRELAGLVGVTHGAIGLYETGRREPDLQTLQRIAQALETSMSFLLGETDDPTPIFRRGQAAHDTSRVHEPEADLDPEDMHDLERAFRNIMERRLKRSRDGTTKGEP